MKLEVKLIINPLPASTYAELDNEYSDGAPYAGCYYYWTYRIHNELIKSDGTVACIIKIINSIAK